MEIANPIYDVVFKYLMEDQKVARIILSALTKLDIIALEFVPQELTVDKLKSEHSILTGLNLSIYRLDFSARIQGRWLRKSNHHRNPKIKIRS
ncbi:MAG: hypothetical protein IPO37_13910 [Saprospiraceae bacterium]|nr:hypothetical protein [Saprospiraceae bacterium]